MPTRDDFPPKTRQALALRAGYICSFPDCGQATAGPSDESEVAVTIVGIAAHIHAAAPGGPRYLATMTREERSSIDNGIWMCAHHAALIDRDEVAYTAVWLRQTKAEHERNARAAVRGHGREPRTPHELIALGPNIVATGELTGAEGRTWRIELHHFVSGDIRALISFGETFERLRISDRHILIGAQGDGRVMSSPPKWERSGGRIGLNVCVENPYPLKAVDELGTDLKIGRQGGLVIDARSGDLAQVSGRDALYQRLWNCMSFQRGQMSWAPEFGARIAEYEALYAGTPWFEALLKLEAIRLAAIPYEDPRGALYTPFLCVERILALRLLPRPDPHSIAIHLKVDVKGLGAWEDDFQLRVRRAAEGHSD